MGPAARRPSEAKPAARALVTPRVSFRFRLRKSGACGMPHEQSLNFWIRRTFPSRDRKGAQAPG